jgi:integrase
MNQEHIPVTTAQKKQTKKQRLLANIDVRRWYDNLSRASSQTAEVRLRRLGHFCETHQMTPMELIELATKDLKIATDLIEDHVTAMEQKGHSSGYIETTLTAVKSWLRHFDIELKRKIRIKNVDSTPTLEDERVPEASEMTEILNRGSLRNAVIISLIAKSGLRPQVLGNYNGTDGLRMKDLSDIVIKQGVAMCLNSLTMIIVRKTLSKTRHQYFTFLTTQGTKRLLAYLNDRLAKGQVLNGDSPVIAPDYEHEYGRGKNRENAFLPTQRVTKEIRKTFRPRFEWRPYVLRAYFDTQLLIAESKGRMAHDFRVFFMGHKGSIEAKYTTNKGVLPEVLINEMREAFKRSEEFLDLETKEDDPLLKQKEDLHGIVEKATPKQMQEMLRKLGICKVKG